MTHGPESRLKEALTGISDRGEASMRQLQAGANLRNVWTIPTQGVSAAHFATFPERLVEPCILAGTSAEGACAKCGAPWARSGEAKLCLAIRDTARRKSVRERVCVQRSGRRNGSEPWSEPKPTCDWKRRKCRVNSD